MNCISSTVKYLLWFLNVIFLAGGVLLIVVGSIMLSDMGGFKSFNTTIHTQTIPILTIILGCIIFIVCFCGCCGTIRNNACCTTTYAVLIFILFVLQLALSIWIFVKQDDFLNNMKQFVNDAWQENTQQNGYPMDGIQLAFKCCGNNGWSDYAGNVPASCCGYTNRNEQCPSSIYETREGCNKKFYDFWNNNMYIISWTGIGIAIFELVIFFIACCLANQMRRQ